MPEAESTIEVEEAPEPEELAPIEQATAVQEAETSNQPEDVVQAPAPEDIIAHLNEVEPEETLREEAVEADA